MLDLTAIFDVGDPPLAASLAPFRPDDLPVDWWQVWDERAAIKEYHGGMHREHAEAEALAEVVQMMSEEEEQKTLDRHPK